MSLCRNASAIKAEPRLDLARHDPSQIEQSSIWEDTEERLVRRWLDRETGPQVQNSLRVQAGQSSWSH